MSLVVNLCTAIEGIQEQSAWVYEPKCEIVFNKELVKV